jgi:hypothetical protein
LLPIQHQGVCCAARSRRVLSRQLSGERGGGSSGSDSDVDIGGARFSTRSDTRVTWVNGRGESRRPYDVVIEYLDQAGVPIPSRTTYVEVKTTVERVMRPPRVSAPEMRAAMQLGPRYIMALVTGANSDVPALRIIRDPFGVWVGQGATVRMAFK